MTAVCNVESHQGSGAQHGSSQSINDRLTRTINNAALMTKFYFIKRFIANGSGTYSSLDLVRVICSFEDTDASSHVVKSRKLTWISL